MKKNFALTSFVVSFLLIFAGVLFAQTADSPVELPKTMLLIMGAISPVLIGLINRFVPEKLRWVIAYALSGVTGIIALAISGTVISVANVALWVPLGFTYSQVAYRTIWYKLLKKIS